MNLILEFQMMEFMKLIHAKINWALVGIQH